MRGQRSLPGARGRVRIPQTAFAARSHRPGRRFYARPAGTLALGANLLAEGSATPSRRSRSSGEGRNRTGDTTVFSRVLYQLSYLAAASKCSLTGRARRKLATGGSHRRGARPRSRPARRGHGPLGHPLRGARRPAHGARASPARTGGTSRPPSRRRPRAGARRPGSWSRSRRRASGSPAGSPTRSRTGGRRWCSAATTRSRSGRWAGSRRCTAPGAVLWFDAHGDLNTPETTPSGNVHGMPLGGRASAARRRRSPARRGRCRRSSPSGSSSSAPAPSTRASAPTCARAASPSTP